MFSITVRDRNTQGKPEEFFHQHKNIREKSLRDTISFKIRVTVVAVVANRQVCERRVDIYPAQPPTNAMSNPFPRQMPPRCHRARLPTSACLLHLISHQCDTVAVTFLLMKVKYKEHIDVKKSVTLTFKK